MSGAAFEVIDPGARTTFQDHGRPGHAAEGVGRSGAADRASHRRANRLAGNDEDAVALEVVLGGLELRALGTVRVVCAGADCPLRSTAQGVGFHVPFTMRRGDTLALGRGTSQVYTYLAVSGGFVAPRVLGSSSTDLLSGLGPPPLAAGDVLHAGDQRGSNVPVDVAPVAPPADPVVLRVLPGPRVDWFAPAALEQLCSSTYVVEGTSSRIALRLDGPGVVRTCVDELPSEALVVGAIQIPPDGRPIVFGVDHPVTGGYPVLAVVVDADLDAAAQAPPGSRIRFRRGTEPTRVGR